MLSDANSVLPALEAMLRKGRGNQQNRSWAHQRVRENRNSARSVKTQWSPTASRWQQALATKAFPPSTCPAPGWGAGFFLGIQSASQECLESNGLDIPRYLSNLLLDSGDSPDICRNCSNKDGKEISLNFGNPGRLALFSVGLGALGLAAAFAPARFQLPLRLRRNGNRNVFTPLRLS